MILACSTSCCCCYRSSQAAECDPSSPSRRPNPALASKCQKKTFHCKYFYRTHSHVTSASSSSTSSSDISLLLHIGHKFRTRTVFARSNESEFIYNIDTKFIIDFNVMGVRRRCLRAWSAPRVTFDVRWARRSHKRSKIIWPSGENVSAGFENGTCFSRPVVKLMFTFETNCLSTSDSTCFRTFDSCQSFKFVTPRIRCQLGPLPVRFFVPPRDESIVLHFRVSPPSGPLPFSKLTAVERRTSKQVPTATAVAVELIIPDIFIHSI